MILNCEICHAKFDVDLIDSEETINFSYYCIFCENKLLESNEKKKFIPKDIIEYPIPQIALPGIIHTLLNNFMDEYKPMFKELSINKGWAKSNLHISLDDGNYNDDYDFTKEGWTYFQIRGTIDDPAEKKSIEDIFKTPGMALAIYFLHEYEQVQIQTLMIPYLLRRKGIGKKIISIIYEACKVFGYRLLVVDMVESFYNRLLERGAIMIDFETVEITDNTKLV